MHPAPSVIVFTVLSGLGFGFLACLAIGLLPVSGAPAFLVWALGYALTVAGLLASTFHLGNPQRALLAFSQWRTSWLSREAWASAGTLVLFAPVALSDSFGWLPRTVFALPGTLLAVATVVCTAMIYTQIRAVPRWHHWTTPALFIGFAATGGAILAGLALAPALAVSLSALLWVAFRLGDAQFAKAGENLGTATGLQGRIAVFELPHTGGNYLLLEMIHVVGRRHADRLRVIAILFAGLLPAAILLMVSGLAATGLAAATHILGAFAARWLFFAEAEHVVGLYYGRR